MWPGLVEVRHPRFENSPEMTFVERNKKVQALAPQAASESFAD